MHGEDEKMTVEDCSDVDVVELVNRDVLVTRRALNMQPKVEDDEEQRGHIFHTKDVI